MHLFHKWGKWEDRQAEYTERLVLSGYSKTSQEFVQTRKCEVCGKRVIRKLS